MTDFPVIPVYYHPDTETVKQLLRACYEGGMRVFEYTNRGEKALEVFREIYPFVREACPEMALGIGTIYDVEQARAFLGLGADFVVQPVITAEVARFCEQEDLIWIPGAATLNEVHQARLLGAAVVKVFPASILTPAFISAVRGPMPDARLMVTGGVLPTYDSLKAWFGAGVVSVGIGSQLFPDHLLKEEKFDKIEDLISRIMQDVANIRSR